MSEMTGNAALLAQVCGWGAGGRPDRVCLRSLLPGICSPSRPRLTLWASWELTFRCLLSCASHPGLASSL